MRTWLACALFVVSLGTPLFADAAACACFCGTAADGAVQIDGAYTDTNPNDCVNACRDDGASPVGCYAREDQFPEHSEICWTQEQCTSGTQAGLGNIWEDDVPECDDRKVPMGYCYAGPKSISTIIAISGDNNFAGLAEYIDAIYRWLVPVMAVVAIIMVMVAGLQYILSRGNPSAVKQAKERMVQAVAGIILLLSAFTLARVLDPRLVEFTQIRIPKIKQVVTLSSGNACETLALAGLQIDSVEGDAFVDKTCSYAEGGVKGVVTSVENVNDEVDIGSWKVGDKCDYTKCEAGARCMSTGCVLCSDVAYHTVQSVDLTDASVDILDPSAVTLYPTTNNCALLSDEDGGYNADKQYCVYTAGGYGEGGSAAKGTYFPQSCVNVPMECVVLRSIASAWITSKLDACSIYGEVEEKQTFTTVITATVTDFVTDDILMKDYANVDTGVYKTVCNDDPCGLGAMQAKRCTFVTGADNDSGTCVGK